MKIKALTRLCRQGKAPKTAILTDTDVKSLSIAVARNARKKEAPALIAIDCVQYVRAGTVFVLKRVAKKRR